MWAPVLKAIAVVAIIMGMVYGVYLAVEGFYDRAYSAGQAAQLAVDTKAIDGLELDAQKKLDAAKAATAKANAENAAIVAKNEVTHANDKATIDSLATKLAAASSAGELRDPYADDPGCGDSGGGRLPGAGQGKPGSPGDAGPSGRVLSAELTQFLDQQAADADAINALYATCRADAIGQAKAGPGAPYQPSKSQASPAE